jgi:DNA polymerase-3 subunit alpha
MTLAGGFDSIAEVNRPSLFASLETLLEHAGDEQEERELGQTSLFDSFTAEEVKLVTPVSAVFKNEPDWPLSKKLQHEKQVVGFYVSGHPMDPWQKICEDWLGWSTERIKLFAEEKATAKRAAPASGGQEWGGGYGEGGHRGRPQRPEVKLAGLFCEIREVMTKKGSRMAFGFVEDLKGKIEVVFFPEAYAACQELLKRATSEAEAVVVTGELEIGEEAPKILVKSLDWAAEAHKGRVQQVVLRLAPSELRPDQLRELKKQILQFRGKCPVRIDFVDPTFKTRLDLPKTVMVSGTPQMVQSINKIFGRDVVILS